MGRKAVPFWERVEKTETCWLWTGCLFTNGYGQHHVSGRRSPVKAHRFAWEDAVGPIPAGLVLDHLCRVKACVRPDHLEPVTVGENLLRGDTVNARNAAKTRCSQGHLLEGGNLYEPPSGGRRCRECARRRTREWFKRVHGIGRGA